MKGLTIRLLCLSVVLVCALSRVCLAGDSPGADKAEPCGCKACQEQAKCSCDPPCPVTAGCLPVPYGSEGCWEIDPCCCPHDDFKLLCCERAEYSLCPERSEFRLLCKPRCEDQKCGKPKCKQHTCSTCADKDDDTDWSSE
jgi:hypothetical protein